MLFNGALKISSDARQFHDNFKMTFYLIEASFPLEDVYSVSIILFRSRIFTMFETAAFSDESFHECMIVKLKY